MSAARVIGLTLGVSGGVLTLIGVGSPCDPHPVVYAGFGSPSCGETLVVATAGIFMILAGAALVVVGSRKNRPLRQLTRTVLAIGLSAGIVAASFVTLTLIPVHRTFTVYNLKEFDAETSCSGVDTIKGSTLSFHWWAATNISFGAWSCSANRIAYQGTGLLGSGSLVSLGGVYSFGTICPPAGVPSNCVAANVTGDYTGPLLEI